jgi:hypothetical protein
MEKKETHDHAWKGFFLCAVKDKKIKPAYPFFVSFKKARR